MPFMIFAAVWAVVATVGVNDSNKMKSANNDKCYYRTYSNGKQEIYCPKNGVK